MIFSSEYGVQMSGNALYTVSEPLHATTFYDNYDVIIQLMCYSSRWLDDAWGWEKNNMR